MAHVEQSEALSRKAKPIASLFKATKANETTKVKLRKLVDAKKREVFDCLLTLPWRIHLGFIYTTRLLSLYNSTPYYKDSILLTLST
jgi:hypothetical protein